MLKRKIEICRAHPVLVATAAGAMVGAANAILLEAGGLWHGNSTGVLSLFIPAAHAPRAGQSDAMQTALLLLIEFAGNVVGFSLLFAVPVAVFVGIRRVFASQKRTASPEERP
ncbi:hypothetical protein P8935_19975 [Telmatobacter sp. DSM 110680]|uniref:DUF4126 domain-containing protein n=1 Tax=Telmatobacter sp. DSM 110680 TaxID=3036704 RepID=A0AAU7DHI9_9BACT